MLLGVRNAIAHGDVLRVPTDRDLQNYTSAAFEVMRFIQHEIYNALREGRYRKAPGDDPTEASDHQLERPSPVDRRVSSGDAAGNGAGH